MRIEVNSFKKHKYLKKHESMFLNRISTAKVKKRSK